ncbi:metallophosphoesterase family protein [Kineococcus gynurae]|uniref:Metallophosphoesterase family protein n=1 Tax=Kineococcus gynurae TaxID=452979 RepID=A0ABV5LSV0_9ACTN
MIARVLHLSDTHVLAADGLHQGRVDTTAVLRRTLAGLAGVGPLTAVVVSGDVSEDGTEESYRTVRGLVEEFAAGRGAVVAWAMGNHDQRVPFARTLLDRDAVDVPVVSVVVADGLRIVCLDSSVPGKGYGALSSGQLAGLRAELATPSERGTVVVVHHPPLNAPTVLHEALALRDPERLLAAVAGHDVRVILSGHYHAPLTATVDGLAVVVAPGVANRTDVLVERGRERARRGSGAVLVEIDPGGAVRSWVLDVPGPGDGEVVVDLDAETVQAIIAEAGR